MPLKFYRVFISFLFLTTFSISLYAQTNVTSADVMRERISKAKAYLVVKNYNAAIYELENIKRESKDLTVNRVLNVLLMNSYLEQGNYEKAQSFLKELHTPKQPNISTDYFAIAGQVVKGAKNQLERYNALGLSVSDRNLPLEASADVENMRKTLELVAEQTRELSKKRELASSALLLLEETSAIRAGLAKDDYDSKRWKDQVSDAREQMMGSRSVIVNAVKNPNAAEKPKSETIALENLKEDTDNSDEIAEANPGEIKLIPVAATPKSSAPVETAAAKKPEKKVEVKKEILPESKTEAVTPKKTETAARNTVAEPTRPRITNEKPANETAAAEEKVMTPKQKNTIPENNTVENLAENNNADSGEPMAVGSLIAFAVRKVNPVYPSTARNMRMTGVVKVEVMIDEDGEVAAVENTNGPAMLRRAAEDAIKKWKFKPFVRDGQPVRATGYVSFNFSL